MNDRFFTVYLDKGRPKQGGWTGVFLIPIDDQGNKQPRVMVTAFGGTNGGRDEAQRYCKALNGTLKAFYNGETTVQLEEPR
jgi:hypothetical protein